MLRIMRCESGGNPNAVGVRVWIKGIAYRAYGLMQDLALDGQPGELLNLGVNVGVAPRQVGRRRARALVELEELLGLMARIRSSLDVDLAGRGVRRAPSAMAQRVYFLALSQAGLSYRGVVSTRRAGGRARRGHRPPKAIEALAVS